MSQTEGRVRCIRRRRRHGNPQAGSRTASAAVQLGTELARRLAGIGCTSIDLAEHAAALVGWGDPAVATLKQSVLDARMLVVATPTYKASFTGLLKLFLDQFDRSELGGLATVALMTGGSPAHALAVEVHLKPVLVEIGASLPTRGIYLTGDAIDDPTQAFADWFIESAAALRPWLG